METLEFPAEFPPETLDGCMAEDAGHGIVLDKFCSGPPVQMDVHAIDSHYCYVVNWGKNAGMASACTLTVGEFRRNSFRSKRLQPTSVAKTGISNAIDMPAKLYVWDVLLHDSILRGIEPRMKVLELGESGWANPNDATREFDVLDVAETIEPIGRGIEHFRCEDIPNYVELLKYACDKRGWNPEEFRAYRTCIEYPIFGTQVQVVFELPPYTEDNREQK